MKRNARKLPCGSGRIARSSEVVTVSGDECPSAFKKNFFELPIFPAGSSDPDDMRRLVVTTLPRHQRKITTQTFVNEQFCHAPYAEVA